MSYDYLLIWIGIGSLITVVIAQRRGHTGAALLPWAFLGGALGPLAIALALISISGEDRRADQPSSGQTALTVPLASPAPFPPAGWYADPYDPARLRFWDGEQWTQHLAAASPQPAPLSDPLSVT